MTALLMPILAILSTQTPADDPLIACFNRYDRAQAIQIEGQVIINNSLPATIKLSWIRPRRMRFTLRHLLTGYELIQSETMMLECDLTERQYGLFPADETIRLPIGEVSDVPEIGFPGALLPNTGVRRVFQIGRRQIAKEKLNGIELQRLTATVESQEGDQVCTAWIGAGGRLYQYSTKGGGPEIVYKFNSEKMEPAPLASFDAEPPVGFSPYMTARMPEPLRPSETVPASGWTVEGGRKQSFAEATSGKVALVVVTSPKCPASENAESFLKKLRADWDTRSAAFLWLSLDRGSPNATHVDPEGTLERALGVPATPCFYLTDAKGTVAQVWYGFDADEAENLKEEILATLAEIAPKKG